jgi:transaldolase / glucose-6-phosphate isomerase
MADLQADLHPFKELGQSLWLNYLRRAFIEAGQLGDMLDVGIVGVTSSPRIFEKAIRASSDYDRALLEAVAQGTPVQQIYETLVLDDIQRTADLLYPIFDQSDGLDGYVTVELDPALSRDATRTVASALRLIKTIDRPNVMVEVPATEEGIEALERLTADGVNVNATHIFSLDVYRRAAQAYIRGIERYAESHSVWPQPPSVSVASISLSPIDRLVDRLLDELDRPDLAGKAGIAQARLLYSAFGQIFSGPQWEVLAGRQIRGRPVRVQRPKWTRTRPPSFRYPETMYVEALIGPDTVCTLDPATVSALRRNGSFTTTLTAGLDEAHAHLARLEKLGIDLEFIGHQLQQESLANFERYFQALIQSVRAKRDELETGWTRLVVELGPYQEMAERRLAELAEARTVCRIWEGDHTVWKPSPEEITNRLGWLHITTAMQDDLERLERFRVAAVEQGYTRAVVLGMGGSSLAPELFGRTFGWYLKLARPDSDALELSVLDTTDAAAIAALQRSLDLKHTLFIVSSKSGGTEETMSLFRYFYNRVVEAVGQAAAGAHFVAITDPGTSLADLAEELAFCDLFINDPNIGGRFSATSYFGLVPAALAGVDLALLLDRALSMAVNSHGCNRPLKGDNVAAQLGTVIGQLALEGRDKLTAVLSPAVAPFGDWLEQLVAESTGKEGKGILPVVGEPLGPPAVYGQDRLFVYLRLQGDDTLDALVEALARAGQPLVTLHLKDIYDLGGQFFVWEMATAVAGHLLGINPFDQPNVEAAKQQARQMVNAYRQNRRLPDEDFTPLELGRLAAFLDRARDGDYIALLAYGPRSQTGDRSLQALRVQLRDRYRLATTVGYGPRYLHATGQLHKGDAGRGLFVQFVAPAETDLPIPSRAGEPEADLTFEVLKRAQAMGDAQALRSSGRRLIRFETGPELADGIGKLLAV